MILFISGVEIFFILFIVIMLFGADKIPGFARGAGKMMRQIKDASADIQREIHKSSDDISDSTLEIKEQIKRASDQLKEEKKSKKNKK